MKRKIIFGVSTMIVIAAVSVFAYVGKERGAFGDLFEANVEALARSLSSKAICYSQYSVNETMRCLVCGRCEYETGAGVDKGGYCKF